MFLYTTGDIALMALFFAAIPAVISFIVAYILVAKLRGVSILEADNKLIKLLLSTILLAIFVGYMLNNVNNQPGGPVLWGFVVGPLCTIGNKPTT